jgi:methionyl-tRNA synthetase
LDWGIPVPVKGAEGKVLYVWFDAPIGYISATKDLTTEWKKYWKDKETRLIHFIGKDNIVFHCIIFPVILKAEGSYILPDNVPANEFLNLEGDKISTSRNWAVWLYEYLQDFQDKQDVLRYVLCANAPETKDNDFTWKDFRKRNNNELVAILGNFVNRTFVLTHKHFNGKVPETSELTDYDREILREIPNIKSSVENSLENFRFREGLKYAMDCARLGNKYLADTEPWNLIKQDESRVKTILNISLQITANLSAIVDPFLPFTSNKLAGFLNIKKLTWNEINNINILPAGHRINEPELLFEKIEESHIEVQLKKLQMVKTNNEKTKAGIKPLKENINFDDFKKLDIRVGTILEAVKVPRTNKLLELKINTGLDTRTVVAGIAEDFKPENITGKQVIILANLESRNIKGIKSQGMILMAEDPRGKLTFVLPEEKTEEGSEIN